MAETLIPSGTERRLVVVVLCVALGGMTVGCTPSENELGHEPGDGDADGDGDGDADVVPEPGDCVDVDSDGFGVGSDCLGNDCDDTDAELVDDCGTDENCSGGVHLTGCPCADEQPTICYTGPAETVDVGQCDLGLRDCRHGVYQPCAGQVLPAAEVCDAVDQDCDGAVDDGVLSPCGNCNLDCTAESIGVGGDRAFDPSEARGVLILPDGSITLGQTATIVNRVIWIANSSAGTVSKVDTTTNEELGRYYTASNMRGDPSRSTVNPRGDVVSINRGGSSATFIMASDCPDQDGDGIVETSQGPDDVMPWGEDECVIWNQPITGGMSRGAAIEEREELDGTVREYVWVSSYNTGIVHEIDVAEGEYTGRQQDVRPSNPYGAAMGPDHTLWVTQGGAQTHMAKMDTTTLEVVQYTAPQGRNFYGITVDRDGYVWTTGQYGAQRFDPETETYDLVEGGCGGGVAADADGNIWTASGYVAVVWAVPEECRPSGITRIDGQTLEAHVIETLGQSHGVAVDFDGHVWGINVPTGDAHKIDPSDESFEVAWDGGGNNSYTYSDMTGFQLVNATQELASYGTIFTGCDAPEPTEWNQLTWDADTPRGTTVRFTARSADTLEALPSATPVLVASQPPDASPADVGGALDAAGVAPGLFLAIEASLQSNVRDAAPVLRQFSVQHSCGETLQ